MTVCLSMIVKNEASVIARCLASVKPFIDSWVIVDTGSTDNTQALIGLCMQAIPGELHERPWKDFASNRNEAIELARGKADYVLVMDADDILSTSEGFTLPPLTADSYKLRIEYAGTTYYRTQLFRPDLDFHYEGVLHEVLLSAPERTEERLEELTYRCSFNGARGSRSSDPKKFEKDAAVLQAALANAPAHLRARYMFYLAQSYRDAGLLKRAWDVYSQRAAMNGFEEETWYSLLEVAKINAKLKLSTPTVINAFLHAYERRPTRAESLCYLAMYMREQDRVAAGYPFARLASKLPRPDDILFIDDSVYAWRAKDEHAVAAYWTGRYDEAFSLNEELLSGQGLPENERERVQRNLDFCRERV
jgi:glycosyltransferase involved in cell wall biosynthesis